ncbi:diguanylate cyclase [Christensenellaceae bacterium NSJ-44]|uniref:Diguanylate cyclase n=1 Tax=Luoshenia tenuis TaxID=2763654 RepID=A0A926HI54_9FIRM|nr:GGDEF domain-containing protein [Luoshenia tenuis]MBC8528422.1 diguanylate cyclase [Luoshenia tenuis]
MKKIGRGWLAVLRSSRDYIRRDKEQIREKNLHALQIVSIVFSVLLAIYTIVAYFFFKNPQLMAFYYVFLGLQAVFDCVLLRVVRKDASTRWVQGLCMSASLLIVGFVIAISVFPYPTRPAIFFPPVLVGMAAIFIFSYERLILLLTGYAAVFAALVMIFKTPQALAYDIWSIIPAYLIAMVCAYNITSLRLGDFHSRMRWMQLSIIDKPTGLLNKAACEDACRACLAEAGRGTHALLVLDIDDFKQVNDTYGHQEGDRVLRRLGALLQQGFHEDDVIGRIGGDEFLVLMKDIDERTAGERALEMVGRIAWSLSNHPELRATCSAGLAIAPEDSKDFDAVFARADQALYQAKQQGKNRLSVL